MQNLGNQHEAGSTREKGRASSPLAEAVFNPRTYSIGMLALTAAIGDLSKLEAADSLPPDALKISSQNSPSVRTPYPATMVSGQYSYPADITVAVNGTPVGSSNVFQSNVEFRADVPLSPGTNTIAVTATRKGATLVKNLQVIQTATTDSGILQSQNLTILAMDSGLLVTDPYARNVIGLVPRVTAEAALAIPGTGWIAMPHYGPTHFESADFTNILAIKQKLSTSTDYVSWKLRDFLSGDTKVLLASEPSSHNLALLQNALRDDFNRIINDPQFAQSFYHSATYPESPSKETVALLQSMQWSGILGEKTVRTMRLVLEDAYPESIVKQRATRFDIFDIATARVVANDIPVNRNPLYPSFSSEHAYYYRVGLDLFGYNYQFDRAEKIRGNVFPSNTDTYPFLLTPQGDLWTSQFQTVDGSWGIRVQNESLCAPFATVASGLGSIALSPKKDWVFFNPYANARGMLVAMNLRTCVSTNLSNELGDFTTDLAVSQQPNGDMKVFTASYGHDVEWTPPGGITLQTFTAASGKWNPPARLRYWSPQRGRIGLTPDDRYLAVATKGSLEFIGATDSAGTTAWSVPIASTPTALTQVTTPLATEHVPVNLQIHPSTPQSLNVSWSPRGGVLQRGPDLRGPWTNVSEANPQEVPAGERQSFFRVRKLE